MSSVLLVWLYSLYLNRFFFLVSFAVTLRLIFILMRFFFMSNYTGVSDSGSNYSFGDKMMSPNVRASQFDLSYINTLTCKQGALIPVYFSYLYPSDRFDVSLESLIRVVNPPVVPLASRQRVFFHMYSMDYSQLWYYWEAMARKGYSGTFEATLPKVTCKLAVDGALNPLLARGSLADYLGFNFSDYTYKSGDENITISLPALPFLAYQRIYRDYYLNKNLNINDDVLLPEIDQDLLIKGKSPQNLTLDGSSQASDEPLNRLPFGKLRYRNYADDYFTTALPWPMRGDVPYLESSIAGSGNVPVDTSGLRLNVPLTYSSVGVASVVDSVSGSGTLFDTGLFLVNNGTSGIDGVPTGDGKYDFSYYFENMLPSFPRTDTFRIAPDNASIASAQPNFKHNLYTVNPGINSPLSGSASVSAAAIGNMLAGLTVTQPALKLLWTNTLINEKLAKTDGTYGDFIQTFFGTSPRHWTDHRATYHGGTYQPIVFSQVLQTAPADSGTVGSQYGQGISSSDGYVGSVSSSDFGIVMVLMSIMPDTYYCQGWMKEHLYQTQDDLPLPERAMLGMQPVLQGEIFFDPRDSSSNETLFGYQSRLDELRYRQNEIHGDVANPSSLSFFPYTQARYFSEAPNLNQEFVTTEGNIRNDWLSAPNEVPYMVQVANRVKAVRPYPYIAPPSAIMM